MRCLKRQTQEIWFSVKSMGYTGIDETSVYSKPEMHKFSVSPTGSTPEDYAAGIVPDYDRYITSFDRNFQPIEGMQCWIDVTPEIDQEGNLVMTDDGDSLALSKPVELKWASKADSTYRALLYYNKVEGKAEPVSLSNVPTPQLAVVTLAIT